VSKEGTVPLSEHEQRLLDEIEQALYAEDPKFASSVRSARARRHRLRFRSTALLCVLGVLAGLGLVLVGLLVNIIVLSVLGFVLLVGSCGYAVQAVRHGRAPAPSAGPEQAPSRSTSLRARMEDRMRRRFDEN
jgi:hypothetical protein